MYNGINKTFEGVRSMFGKSLLPSSLSLFGVAAYAILLGTHLVDYHAYILVAVALVLVDMRAFKTGETLLLFGWLAVLYLIWYTLDPTIFRNFRFVHGIVVFLSYLVGMRAGGYLRHGGTSGLFFILYAVAGAYMVMLLYSYVFLEQPPKLNGWGMQVCFDNEYKRCGVHDGRLISTILAYYLSVAAVMAAFVLWRFPSFMRRIRSMLGAIAVLGLGGFALYLAEAMGRRTVIGLFVLAFLYLAVRTAREQWGRWRETGRKRYAFLLAAILFAAFAGGYMLWHDSHTMQRILSGSLLHDRRFSWWLPALHVIWEYPFGGGHGVFLAHNMRLAHNTWIDIGKDFGVVPFVAGILFFLRHLYLLYRLLRGTYLPSETKDMLLLYMMVFLAVLFVEPVFTSDKIYLAYVMIYLGVLRGLYGSFDQRQNPVARET